MLLGRSYLVAIAVSMVAGCGDNQDPAGADSLWDRIHAENYRSFARAPGWETRKPTGAPHAKLVDIYINKVFADALAAKKKLAVWPVGALVVKDGFDADGDLAIVAVEEKRADGWFYVEYTDVVKGTAKYSGQPSICLNCHTDSNDHINAFALPSGQ
jgi:hypothetical protein